MGIPGAPGRPGDQGPVGPIGPPGFIGKQVQYYTIIVKATRKSLSLNITMLLALQVVLQQIYAANIPLLRIEESVLYCQKAILYYICIP